ncbi:5-dehydro-4-deoxyglucarate dehydratase [Burkholderia thailandensis]|uniref:Probable 5-dehydro-4-deoxyglucarate dehydratase n=2 Tax=Burkholderia thailandensis TaxID=57975 RepID=A0AAW9CY95_BURTH|nr:5-dehydro-4-deoxyglucarate dehydratase [Burkholderia thailandensis]AHI64471.1 5-dehydro-4-deoxyglucarate dehydratase [Burkholderia thailandensis H0587]AIP62705.1 5-dehydro-4-deoxyglucarate dehydratase [Burkholderia thailandensis]AJY29153.1 5-dehydro-4-deoxyglucarate dehydratase [Burkholderia thailandensis 34]AOI53276.1 5-dehydro-4-deoxyglucarate dehydratase [Burkholderia thailandensis]AOJ52297.1 5-dehydro-4-deoxyglucarate dehydratase [Burkholderia thailandensis]
MSRYTPTEFARQIGSGLLSFPVTHFKADLSFDEAAYRANLGWLFSHDAAGLFAAGGTGEFFSLTPAEVDRVVRAAVAETGGRLPVIAPAGYGTAMAIDYCKAAEAAGADGILLLPPYLTEASADGVAAHVEQVCRATRLGVIVYNRANQVLDENALARLAERCPNLVGFKDGVGDIELMTRIYTRLGERFTYIGGLPTAETFALPYLTLGVTTYSSAIFNFVPRFALDFYAAVRAQDHAKVYAMLDQFVLPYIALRNRKRGYAVSIVKAGMRVVGRSAGPVRAPLTDLTGAELAELSALVARIADVAEAQACL